MFALTPWMTLRPVWPPAFALALTVFRQALKSVPVPLLQSTPMLQQILQPIANSAGWPSMLLPRGISVMPGVVGGIPGEWYLPGNKKSTMEFERMLLWAHGGGFFFCSPGTHRLFLSKVASHSNLPVFCVKYRKPPQFSSRTCTDDVLKVYEDFRRRDANGKVFLGGDSAGGNIALVATRRALARGLAIPPPSGVVLLSPWVDLTDFGEPSGGDSWALNGHVDYIPARHAAVVAELFQTYGDGTPLDDASMSPGRCLDWAGCPPVLLDYGACEVFRSQIEVLIHAMEKEGVTLDALGAEGMIHVYPLFDFLWGPSEGPFERYFQRVARFLNQ